MAISMDNDCRKSGQYSQDDKYHTGDFSMMTKTSLSTLLAAGMLSLCSSAMAEAVQAQAKGFLNAEIAWLLGALILGLCVIARRRPLPHTNREPAPEPDTATGNSEQWQSSETKAAASNRLVPTKA